jgi:hypothetical protein
MSRLAFLNHYGGLKCLKCDFVINKWSLLVPSLNGQVKSGSDQTGPSGDDKTKHNFVLHGLNNKEMEFTVQAEKIMEDLLKMALEKDDVSAEAFEYELTHPDKVLKLKQITVSQCKIQWPKILLIT